MFDSYTTTNRTVSERYEVTKEIHEHKAPTDESIRLFNEMTDKALANIVARWSTDNNTLSMKGAFWENHATGVRTLGIKLKINGKDHNIVVDIDPFMNNIEEMCCLVFERVSKELATAILQPIFNSVSEQIQN